MTEVTVKMTGAVATVLIDRPPVNALSSDLLRALARTFDELRADAELRCVVLSAAGDRHFVAGADIKEALATDPERAGERTALGAHLMRTIEALPVPVIAAINGACLGGGCELALAADLRIAADHARLGQPEIRLGIIPGFGGTQRLPRLIGVGPALDLLLSGRDVGAEEALRLGLVSRVVPGVRLRSEADEVAAQIARRNPVAVRAIKLAVRQGIQGPLADGLGLELDLSNTVRRSAGAVEGLRAFVEKRPPHVV